MKILDGQELAGYIKERQAKQVRALRQAHHVFPRLAIVQTIDDPVIDSYVRLKRLYGDDILVEVEVYRVDQADVADVIARLNHDASTHGIIVQLPLARRDETDMIVNMVAPEKDVDGLGASALLEPATPLAIDWLVTGYGISLAHKKIAIVGNGRLVGAPLARRWQSAGYDVTIVDVQTDVQLRDFDVIVSATGVPGRITIDDVKIGGVVVDAGTAAEHGKIVGDVAAEVRTRDDITITPEKGGVGPLTVVALFDNVIRAAQATIPQEHA